MNLRHIGLAVAGIILVVLLLLNRKDIQPTKQTNWHLQRVTNETFDIKSDLSIYNPNLLSSTIKVVREKIFVNGIAVGNFYNELEQGISGRNETTFPISVRISKQDLNRALGIKGIVTKKAPVSVRTEIKFSNFSGSGSVQITLNDTLSITP